MSYHRERMGMTFSPSPAIKLQETAQNPTSPVYDEESSRYRRFKPVNEITTVAGPSSSPRTHGSAVQSTSRSRGPAGSRVIDASFLRLRDDDLVVSNYASDDDDMDDDASSCINVATPKVATGAQTSDGDSSSSCVHDKRVQLQDSADKFSHLELMVNRLDTKVTKLEVERECSGDNHDEMEDIPMALESRMRTMERTNKKEMQALHKQVDSLEKVVDALRREVAAAKKSASGTLPQPQQPFSTHSPGPSCPTSAPVGAEQSASARPDTQKTEPGIYISDNTFVQFLIDMDCTKQEHLVCLQSYLSTPYSREFLLLVKSNTEKFYLRIGGRNRQVLPTQTRVNLELPQAQQPREHSRKAKAAGLLETILFGARGAPTAEALGIPRHVVDLGEVHLFARNTKSEHERRSYTNYHVVMDVGSPSKALWLVYQIDKLSEQVNVPRVRYAEFLPTRLQPPGWAGFTIAQLTENIEGWKALDEADMSLAGPIAHSPDLIAETANQQKPVFAVPVYDVAMKAIKEGWGKADNALGLGE